MCSYTAADASARLAAADAEAEGGAAEGAADAAADADAGALLAAPPEQAARKALVAVRPAAARKPRLGTRVSADPSQHGVVGLFAHVGFLLQVPSLRDLLSDLAREDQVRLHRASARTTG